MGAEREIVDTNVIETLDANESDKFTEGCYLSILDLKSWIDEAIAKAPEEQRDQLLLRFEDDELKLVHPIYETDEEMAERLADEAAEEERRAFIEANKITFESGLWATVMDGSVEIRTHYRGPTFISLEEFSKLADHVKTRQAEAAASVAA